MAQTTQGSNLLTLSSVRSRAGGQTRSDLPAGLSPCSKGFLRRHNHNRRESLSAPVPRAVIVISKLVAGTHREPRRRLGSGGEKFKDFNTSVGAKGGSVLCDIGAVVLHTGQAQAVRYPGQLGGLT